MNLLTAFFETALSYGATNYMFGNRVGGVSGYIAFHAHIMGGSTGPLNSINSAFVGTEMIYAGIDLFADKVLGKKLNTSAKVAATGGILLAKQWWDSSAFEMVSAIQRTPIQLLDGFNIPSLALASPILTSGAVIAAVYGAGVMSQESKLATLEEQIKLADASCEYLLKSVGTLSTSYKDRNNKYNTDIGEKAHNVLNATYIISKHPSMAADRIRMAQRATIKSEQRATIKSDYNRLNLRLDNPTKHSVNAMSQTDIEALKKKYENHILNDKFGMNLSERPTKPIIFNTDVLNCTNPELDYAKSKILQAEYLLLKSNVKWCRYYAACSMGLAVATMTMSVSPIVVGVAVAANLFTMLTVYENHNEAANLQKHATALTTKYHTQALAIRNDNTLDIAGKAAAL